MTSTNTQSKKIDGQYFTNYLEQTADRNIMFFYGGYLNEDVLFGMGQALRTKMLIEGVEPTASRRVFSGFVEQVQNVIRYSDEKISLRDADVDDEEATTLSYGVVAVGDRDDGKKKFVSCCNVIEEQDVERVSISLDKLRGLSRKELGALMRQQLREATPAGSVGAGVGFISIAWEADGNWDYEMIKTPEHTLFCFEAKF